MGHIEKYKFNSDHTNMFWGTIIMNVNVEKGNSILSSVLLLVILGESYKESKAKKLNRGPEEEYFFKFWRFYFNE